MELYLYSPTYVFMACTGVTYTLHFRFHYVISSQQGQILTLYVRWLHVPPFRPKRACLLILFFSERHIFTSPHSINLLVFISQLVCVYCAVRAGHLNRLVSFRLCLFFEGFHKSPLLAQDKNARRYLSVTSVTLERILTSSIQSLSFLRTECISMF
jgi:hypothetical protein